ncbi:MAG: Kelch repeat-containing protein [Thermodesulfobacteriota bacterium]
MREVLMWGGTGGAICGNLYHLGLFKGVNGILQVYDPALDTPDSIDYPWNTISCGYQVNAAGAVFDGKLYVAGGCSQYKFFACPYTILYDFEVYDRATNTCTLLAPVEMPIVSAAAAWVEGKLYVAGGFLNGCPDDVVNSPGTMGVYDPATDTWTTKAPMPTPREGAMAAALNGKLYVVGGLIHYCFVSDGVWTGTLEVYDPATDTWTTKAPMPTARGFFGVGVMNGKLYAIGGFNSSGFLATVEVYDPGSDTWATNPPMPTARAQGLVIGVINGQLYAAGGLTWSLDPAEDNPTSLLQNLLQNEILADRPGSGVLEVYTEFNTPVGTNVVVQPVDATMGTTPVTLTFDNVTQGGTASLTTSTDGPPPPSGFELGSSPTYYELITTAVFSSSVNVCIDYSGISFVDESLLKLFHFENGAWVDQTTSLDTMKNIICASVNSLSPLAIFEAAYIATGQQPINPDGSSVFKANRGVVPVKFTLTLGGVNTCNLPSANISLIRTSGGTIGPVDESIYIMPADTGSNFRISDCQYIYNLGVSSLGSGTYLVQIKISGFVVGSATFGLN